MGDMASYIKRFQSEFSKAEARIADYVIANPKRILDYSVEDLALATGTSGATIVRFCRTIGFRGYTDLKYQVEHSALYVMESEQQIDRNDDIQTIKNKVLKYEENLIREFSRSIDTTAIDAACNCLSHAARVLIFAEGGSAAMAMYAKSSFIHTGIYCSVETDALLQITSAEYATKNDIVIGISHSGRIINTVDALRVAHERGATVIAITGSSDTPICRYADIILTCNNKHHLDLSDYQGSHLEEFCIISVLQIGTLMKSYDTNAAISKRISNSAEKKRLSK